MKLIIAAFNAATAQAGATDKSPDPTTASAKAFISHLGRAISISGRFEQGMQSACLSGAAPVGVFYILFHTASTRAERRLCLARFLDKILSKI